MVFEKIDNNRILLQLTHQTTTNFIKKQAIIQTEALPAASKAIRGRTMQNMKLILRVTKEIKIAIKKERIK